MRKESQHYQTEQCPSINISRQCQEATKKFTRTHQIKSKHDFLEWLRSLPFEIRYLAVKVEAPGLAHAIRDALRRFYSKIESHQMKKSLPKFQKNILDSLVFTSDGRQFFDSICFDFSFIEFPEKLYELLMYSGDNTKKFNPIEDMEKNRLSIKQSCVQISQSKSKEQLCKNLVRILRHQVFFNICHKKSIQINDQKNRKKQFSFYWKNLPQQLKLNILSLKHQSVKGLFTFLNQQQIALPIDQIEKQIALLIKLQKNQFCNRIFKCKLKKSLSYLTDYHQLIYKLWKSEHENVKRRKNRRTTPISMLKNPICLDKKQQQMKYKSQQKKQQSQQMKQKHQQKKQKHQQKKQKHQYKKQKYEQKKQKYEQKKQKYEQKKQKHQYKKQKYEQKKQKYEQKKQKYEQKKQKYEQKKQKQISETMIQKQWSINSFDTNQTQIYQKQQQSQLKHQFFKQSFLHRFIQKTIHQKIVQFSQHISKQANTFYNARLVAFERISFIMEFYGINIKVFGSCASAIAVKNSDIDIAVDYAITNFFHGCNQNDKVKFSLQWLQTVFSAFSSIKNIRLIKGATIPLLKLTIDTSQLFDLDQNLFNFDVSQYVQYLSRPHRHSLIQMDISIETHSQSLVCNHLGLNTTHTINRWFQQIKPLKFIIIIMKYFLDLQQLNNTYKQGINTYGVIVMFVAVIKHLKLQKEVLIGNIWHKVLTFIVYQFDQKLYGIDLRNKHQVFYRKNQQTTNQFTKADLEVLDPENSGYNMTRKCYKYQLIKELFQKIQKRCFSDLRKKIISSFLKDKKLSFANIRNQNNLKKQSLNQIAKTMQNPFMQLLKEIKPEFNLISEAFTQNQSAYESFDQFPENMALLKTQSITN